MNRIGRAALLVVIGAFSLSGCVRCDITMTLWSDNTASGTVIQAVQKGAADQLEVETDAEALTKVFGDAPFDSHFTATDYTDGVWVGKSYSFSRVPIGELGDLASLFTVTRYGDTYQVDGVKPPLTEDQRAQLPDGARSKLSITFPLPVTESNGAFSGNTVTWDLLKAAEPLHASGGAAVPKSGPSTEEIAGGVGVVAVAAIALVMAMRRRRRRAAVVAVRHTPAAAIPSDTRRRQPEAAPLTPSTRLARAADATREVTSPAATRPAVTRPAVTRPAVTRAAVPPPPTPPTTPRAAPKKPGGTRADEGRGKS